MCSGLQRLGNTTNRPAFARLMISNGAKNIASAHIAMGSGDKERRQNCHRGGSAELGPIVGLATD
jgi:hypothetical protein